jgi:uncharacterized membrane protein
MYNTRNAKLIFLLLLFISFIIPVFLYPQLPYKMAAHFNIKSSADNWMNKNYYLIVHYIILFFFSSVFWVMALLMPRLPRSLFNLPNKDYWLHETRKEKTVQVLQAMLYWLGCFTLLLFDFVFYQVFKANVDGTNKLSSFSWISIFIYVSANIIIILKYIAHFNNKEN